MARAGYSTAALVFFVTLIDACTASPKPSPESATPPAPPPIAPPASSNTPPPTNANPGGAPIACPVAGDKGLTEVGDVDGDGAPDQIRTSAELRQAELVLRSKTGTCRRGELWLPGPSETHLAQDAQLVFYALGDVNKDGAADVALMVPMAPSSWVITGGQRGLVSGVAVSRLALGANQDVLGGDVNGDGFSDFVGVLNPHDREGPYRVGVHLGGPSGIATTPSIELDTGDEAWELGTTMTTRGDFDGDGVKDIVVGAYRSPARKAKQGDVVQGQGAVYVWRGGTTISPAPSWVLRPPAKDLVKRKDTAFGVVLGIVDHNRDGIDDLQISGGLYDCHPACPGRNDWIFLGGRQGLSTTPTSK